MNNTILKINTKYIIAETNSVHIFLYVVRREQDFFLGIKENLKNIKGTRIYEIKFTDGDYQKINSAEYARPVLFKKFAEGKFLRRLFNYKKIFSKLEFQLHKIIESADLCENTYIYIADEGVWAETVMTIRKRLKNRNIKIINIQHGSFILRKAALPAFRKIINQIFVLIWNYPIFGMGFGGSKMDIYYLYGHFERLFVEKLAPQSLIFEAPEICKYELITEVAKEKMDIVLVSKFAPTQKNILFAAQPNEIIEDCLFSEDEIYEKMAPFFMYLSESGYRVFFRFHPVMKNNPRYIEILTKYKIIENVTIIENWSLAKQLAVVDIVMSFQSTVLFDGFCVGCMPIVINGFLRESNFPVDHESINILGNWKEDFNKAIGNIGFYKKSKQFQN